VQSLKHAFIVLSNQMFVRAVCRKSKITNTSEQKTKERLFSLVVYVQISDNVVSTVC